MIDTLFIRGVESLRSAGLFVWLSIAVWLLIVMHRMKKGKISAEQRNRLKKVENDPAKLIRFERVLSILPWIMIVFQLAILSAEIFLGFDIVGRILTLAIWLAASIAFRQNKKKLG